MISALAQVTPEPSGWLEVIRTGGLVVVVLLLGLAVKWLVEGKLHGDKEHQALVKDRDFYRELALRSVNAGESIAKAAGGTVREDLEAVAYEAAQRAASEAVHRERRDAR